MPLNIYLARLVYRRTKTSMVGQEIGRLIMNNGDDINAKRKAIFVYHEV
jgi:hypothetical protein